MGDASGRTPTGTVLLNGVSVPWEKFTVTNNTNYNADTFSLTLPVSSLPVGLQRVDLADIDTLAVEVRAALDGSSGTTLIIGVVDEIVDDYAAWEITLTGRDRTADFLDAKTTEKFQNQTASQIVQTLAARHDLTTDVTRTSTKAGKYYEIDNDKLTDESTEWDLLTYLAQKEDFDVWVEGSTVHFHPSSQTYGTPLMVTYVPQTGQAIASANFVTLSTHRALTLASDVKVTVSSWNHKQKKAFTVTATGKKTGSKSGGTPQAYSYRIAGMTHEQALQYAQSKLEEVSRHERVIDIAGPADVTTVARMQIQLTGTATAFDQTYWIDEIQRELTFGEGFGMTIKAKNHSPQTTVSA